MTRFLNDIRLSISTAARKRNTTLTGQGEHLDISKAFRWLWDAYIRCIRTLIVGCTSPIRKQSTQVSAGADPHVFSKAWIETTR